MLPYKLFPWSFGHRVVDKLTSLTRPVLRLSTNFAGRDLIAEPYSTSILSPTSHSHVIYDGRHLLFSYTSTGSIQKKVAYTHSNADEMTIIALARMKRPSML